MYDDTLVRMSLGGAIASILGRKDHEDYKYIGVQMKIQDLYKLLGLTNSPMLYNYMSGKTQNIEPERAMVILNNFNILIDQWATEEDLKVEAINVELGNAIAREPIREIIEEIVEVERSKSLEEMTRGLRKLIARYY